MNKIVIAILALSFLGASTFVASIYLLAGLAWAILSSSVFLFGSAVLLREGLKHG